MMEHHPAPNCRHCVRPKQLDDAQLEGVLRQLLQRNGWTEAPAELAHARLQCCATCAKNDGQGTCLLCGCLLSIRTRIREQQCPHPQGALW